MEDDNFEVEELLEWIREDDAQLSDESPISEAVEVSDFLARQIEIFGELPQGDPKFAVFYENVSFQKAFSAANADFCYAVLQAMADLPESPGRRPVSTAELQALRAQIAAVRESLKVAKTLLKILSKAIAAKKGATAPTWSALITKYISGYGPLEEDGDDPYHRFRRVSEWVWRRSEHYKKTRKAYLEKPEVQERIKNNRPSLESERDRKRRAYWLRKGFSEPPARKAKPEPKTPSEADSVQAMGPTALEVLEELYDDAPEPDFTTFDSDVYEQM